MAVIIPTTPAVDPAFLAFLRSQGIEESELSGEVQRRTSALTRGLQRRLPAYAEQKAEGLKDASESFESRGLFRSGERLLAQQKVANSSDRQRLEDETGTRDSIADLEGGYARGIAGMRRQQAERELSTRTGLV